MPRRSIGRLHGAVIASLLLGSIGLAGCGSATPAATTSPAPAATPAASEAAAPSVAASIAPTASASAAAALPRSGRIAVASSGYAVTLPDNWFRVDLTKDDLEAFAKAGSQSMGPGMTDQLAAQLTSLVASGITLFAYRFADADAVIGTNLNVIVLPSGGMDLDALERLNIGQLQGIVGKDVTIDHARETLPAGEGIRLQYTIPASAKTNGQAVALLQHLVLGTDKQLILTCTAPGGISKVAGECDAMAKTIEFLE